MTCPSRKSMSSFEVNAVHPAEVESEMALIMQVPIQDLAVDSDLTISTISRFQSSGSVGRAHCLPHPQRYEYVLRWRPRLQ